LENHKLAKEAGQTQIAMFRNSMVNEPNSWMLTLGSREQPQPQTMQPAQVAYIS